MGFFFLSDHFTESPNMARGPKKHMKRLAAPKSWMLDKLGGVYSVRPSSGPHRMGESMPISIFLRNRLKYALTAKEVATIMRQRLIKVDGKVRTDARFPAGFMDVIQIEKTERTSVSSTTSRDVTPSTGLPTRRPSTNCAAFVKSKLDPKTFPTCTPQRVAPSATLTPS